MTWFFELIKEESVAHAVLFLSLTIFLGLFLGRLKAAGIGLGIAGVLFTGLLIGHAGIAINKEVLHFIRELGLIFFVFSIGLEIGPSFLNTLKKNGLTLNLLAAGVVFLGLIIAAIIYIVFDVPLANMVGILCGAVTNTPSLGAAQQALMEQGGKLAEQAPMAGLGYAVAYPFGIIGIIVTMLLVKSFFKIKIENEAKSYNKAIYDDTHPLSEMSIIISNPLLIGKPYKVVQDLTDNNVVISRLYRNNELSLPKEETLIEKGDTIHVVVDRDYLDKLRMIIGEPSAVDLRKISGRLAVQQMVVTQKAVAGKTIGELRIFARYNANITRIFRAGLEFIPDYGTTVEIGDTVRVVGEKDELPLISKELGDSPEELNHPNILPMFIGIFIGVIIGSIPIMLPGLSAPVKMGLAGGPLLVAIALGKIGRIGPISFYMPQGANLILREIGIVLFLSCVGIASGGKFVSSIIDGGGIVWMLYGAIITFVPVIIIGIIARLMKYNYLTICGLLAGAMTDPPALSYANGLANSQAQAATYAAVYPFVMFLRVLTAQIFVLLLL